MKFDHETNLQMNHVNRASIFRIEQYTQSDYHVVCGITYLVELVHKNKKIKVALIRSLICIEIQNV